MPEKICVDKYITIYLCTIDTEPKELISHRRDEFFVDFLKDYVRDYFSDANVNVRVIDEIRKCIKRGEYGKPYIDLSDLCANVETDGNADMDSYLNIDIDTYHILNNLQFSVSHSGDVYAVAWCCAGIQNNTGAIGLDIEVVRDSKNMRRDETRLVKIANRFFCDDEVAYVVSTEDTTDVGIAARFFEIWTAKEAYVKMLGRGLGYGLDAFSVFEDDISSRLIKRKVMLDDQLIYLSLMR
jgi:phosphopantetheinyl transferase (holo-ACP synthase)